MTALKAPLTALEGHCGACGAALPFAEYRGQPAKWCDEGCRAWARRDPGEVRPMSICSRCLGPSPWTRLHKHCRPAYPALLEERTA